MRDLLLPDGIPSIGSAHEEVVLTLRHDNVGALHGGQLSCVGGVSWRWWLMRVEKQKRRVVRDSLKTFAVDVAFSAMLGTHWDGNATAS